MSVNPLRTAVRFDSGSDQCAAWHYPGTNGACIVMAGGFAVTKEPATDRFAARFQQAGYSVLAFDYRGIGDSSGEPRQVLPLHQQHADWRAALDFARTLPSVDQDLIVAWGFSLSGGHLLRLAAERSDLAAVIAQTPFVGGLTANRAAVRYQSPSAMARFVGIGLVDVVRGLLRRPPRLMPLAGPRGSVAILTTPDGQQGDRALNPDNRYPDWIQAVAARSALNVTVYRPGRFAKRIASPLLVVVCENDVSALAASAVHVAHRAPDSEVASFPGGHYAPFLDAHDDVVAAEVDFLQRRLFAHRALATPSSEPA